MVKSVEQRLADLEDIQAITRLKSEYCNIADCGWDGLTQDGNRLAALFVADGVWEAGPQLRLAGRDAIRDFFNASPFPFGFHAVTNPVIAIDGDRATGQWHLFCPSINAAKEQVWIGAIYNDEFVRTAAGWRFAKVQVKVAFTSRNEPGWECMPAVPEKEEATWLD